MQKILLFIVIICGGYVYPSFAIEKEPIAEAEPTDKKVENNISVKSVSMGLLGTVITLTNKMSVDWDHRVMKEFIDASNFINNEVQYKKIFTKHAHLGKLKKCKNIRNVELEQENFLIKVIKEDCEFENGNAFIQLIFKSKDSNDKLMGITIKEITEVIVENKTGEKN